MLIKCGIFLATRGWDIGFIPRYSLHDKIAYFLREEKKRKKCARGALNFLLGERNGYRNILSHSSTPSP